MIFVELNCNLVIILRPNDLIYGPIERLPIMSDNTGTDNVKVVRELVKIMTSNDLVEIKIKDEEKTIHLRRPEPKVEQVMTQMAPQYMQAPVSAPASQPVAVAPSAAPAVVVDDSLADISSPIVGTFYTSPSPEAGPFVKVGDRVTADTVVCIIEAMKVMNEIKAEVAGVIEQILVSNGQAVEYGQAMFKVKPD